VAFVEMQLGNRLMFCGEMALKAGASGTFG
jgi:hypothetical protein